MSETQEDCRAAADEIYRVAGALYATRMMPADVPARRAATDWRDILVRSLQREGDDPFLWITAYLRDGPLASVFEQIRRDSLTDQRL